MPGKRFTTQEKIKIVNMQHAGNSYAEIAKEIGRSVKAVNNFCQRYRLRKKDFKKNTVAEAEQRFLDGPTIEVDGDIIGTITPLSAPAKQTATTEVAPEQVEPMVTETEAPVVYAQSCTLDDFGDNDLIKALYDRGYRIEDGKLVCYIKKPVQLNEILGI